MYWLLVMAAKFEVSNTTSKIEFQYSICQADNDYQYAIKNNAMISSCTSNVSV